MRRLHSDLLNARKGFYTRQKIRNNPGTTSITRKYLNYISLIIKKSITASYQWMFFKRFKHCGCKIPLKQCTSDRLICLSCTTQASKPGEKPLFPFLFFILVHLTEPTNTDNYCYIAVVASLFGRIYCYCCFVHNVFTICGHLCVVSVLVSWLSPFVMVVLIMTKYIKPHFEYILLTDYL